MVQTFVKHLVKTDRVDKQASVDPVNIRNLNIDAMQKESVDLIALQRLFLSWLQDDTWYVDDNKNGKIDTAFVDDDEDGIIEAIMLDENENQVWEILIVDEDLNGYPDLLFMDRDEDGKADVIAYDYNEDGEWDKFEKLT